MMSPIRILIVEDQLPLAENIAEYFGGERYSLDFAYDGLTALHLMAVNHYDVIVLDVMLPGLSGFELCQRFRNDLKRSTPIILATARDGIDDKIEGFDKGADDYLVKPFDLRELKARIEVLHKRSAMRAENINAGIVSFDAAALKVRVGDGPLLSLGSSNAVIFEILIKRFPGFVSHNELSTALSIGAREVDTHTLRTHVYNLRRQLKDAFGHDLIETVRGRGYRLTRIERP